MTPTDVSADAFERSLDLMAERVGDPAPRVYARLFAAFPEVEAEFARDVDGAVRGEMLAIAFQTLLELDGGWGGAMIRAEVGNHDNFGVPRDRFAAFFGVLRDICREALGDDWSAEIDAAWTERLARVAALIS